MVYRGLNPDLPRDNTFFFLMVYRGIKCGYTLYEGKSLVYREVSPGLPGGEPWSTRGLNPSLPGGKPWSTGG